jgi:hypothetical protein
MDKNLARKTVYCCGRPQAGKDVTVEKVAGGVTIVDFPAVGCPSCGTIWTDVEMGALLEEATNGMTGRITMAEVPARADGGGVRQPRIRGCSTDEILRAPALSARRRGDQAIIIVPAAHRLWPRVPEHEVFIRWNEPCPIYLGAQW